MRRRRWSFTEIVVSGAALLAAASIVGACASFTTADTSPAIEDGGREASSAEASAPEANAPDAGSAGFCAMHPATICSDFDGENPLQGWTLDTRGGTLETTDTIYRSPLRSLRSTIDGMMTTAGRLTHLIPPTAKRVRLSFEIELGQTALTMGQQISFAEIFCGSTSVDEGAYLFLEDSFTNLAAYAGDGAMVRTPLPSLVQGDWTAVVVDARFDATPTVTVTIAGAASAPMPLASTCAGDPVFEVRLGLSTYTGVTGQAFLDNVLYEVDPIGP